MGRRKTLIVGTVLQYSKEKQAGIAVSGGCKFRFDIRNSDINSVEKYDALVFASHGRQLKTLFNIREGSTLEGVVDQITSWNSIPHLTDNDEDHKHGVIKFIRGDTLKFQDSNDPTGALKTVRRNSMFINDIEYDLIADLGVEGKIIYHRNFLGIINSLDVDDSEDH